jgi:hypothetical protein
MIQRCSGKRKVLQASRSPATPHRRRPIGFRRGGPWVEPEITPQRRRHPIRERRPTRSIITPDRILIPAVHRIIPVHRIPVGDTHAEGRISMQSDEKPIWFPALLKGEKPRCRWGKV